MRIFFYTIIFGFAYLLWTYIAKARKHSRCVDDELIMAYRKGKLKDGDADYDHLLAHLGTCEKCRDRMSDF